MTISNSMRRTMTRRRRLHARTAGKCFYCAIDVQCADEALPRDWLPLRGNTIMVADHAHPLARGGADEETNLNPSCWHCNAAKGWLTVEEFRFVKGLRSGDLSFSFPGEGPRPRRNWLCCHSEEFERDLFVFNFPSASDAFSRGKPIRRRRAVIRP